MVHVFNMNTEVPLNVMLPDLYVPLPTYDTLARQDAWDPKKRPHKHGYYNIYIFLPVSLLTDFIIGGAGLSRK